MDSGQFTRTAAALLGPRWKTPLAHMMGVSRESVSRWAGGHQDIPPWASRFV
jgi:hypothetical protein